MQEGKVLLMEWRKNEQDKRKKKQDSYLKLVFWAQKLGNYLLDMDILLTVL